MLTPIKENFPELTACQILSKIGGTITGLWLSKRHYRQAHDFSGTEGDALKLLARFDEERNFAFGAWKAYQ